MNYEWNNRIATEVGVRMLYVVHNFHTSSAYNNRCHTVALRIKLLMRFSLEKENVVCHKRRGKLENAARRLILKTN
jgi:hypothetical protein